jgi:hypothetical protein
MNEDIRDKDALIGVAVPFRRCRAWGIALKVFTHDNALRCQGGEGADEEHQEEGCYVP